MLGRDVFVAKFARQIASFIYNPPHSQGGLYFPDGTAGNARQRPQHMMQRRINLLHAIWHYRLQERKGDRVGLPQQGI